MFVSRSCCAWKSTAAASTQMRLANLICDPLSLRPVYKLARTVVVDCFPRARVATSTSMRSSQLMSSVRRPLQSLPPLLGSAAFRCQAQKPPWRWLASSTVRCSLANKGASCLRGLRYNSPAALAGRADTHRPVILLSSLPGSSAVSRPCALRGRFRGLLRNYTAAASYLAARFRKIAVIGAGTRDEFREEDQMCCAWIAGLLMEAGYKFEDNRTNCVVQRWRGARVNAWTGARAPAYLRRSGQLGEYAVHS